jgi:non-homologous end joining protein Ku
MARKLIDEMSGPFRPGDFQDTYRTDLMQALKDGLASGRKARHERAPCGANVSRRY